MGPGGGGHLEASTTLGRTRWAAPSVALLATAHEPRAAAAGSRRLLVVDDEPDILATLPEVLERLLALPVEIDVASSGPEAQEKARRQRYDLVISDERMPGMQGSEFLAWLGQVQPDAGRVLMSAYLEAYAPRTAGAPRAHLYVRKPFRLAEFIPQLHRLLTRPPGAP